MKKSTYDDVDDDDDGDDKIEIRQNRAKTSSIDSDEDFFFFFLFFNGAKKINVTKLYLFWMCRSQKSLMLLSTTPVWL